LDQLTAVEVSRASACVRKYAAAEGITGTLRFNTIMLKEPPKAQMLAFWKGRGPKPERRAVVWVINAPKGDFFEAIVALAEGPAALAGSGAAAALDQVQIWRKVCWEHLWSKQWWVQDGLF
jgi:primary-amine oxidase